MGKWREIPRQIATNPRLMPEIAVSGWLTPPGAAGTVARSNLFHLPQEAAMTVKDPARPVARCAPRLI